MTLKLMIKLSLIAFISTTYATEQKLCFNISGLTGELAENAKSSIGIYKNQPCLSFVKFKQLNKVYHAGPAAIKSAIEPFGYFKSTVSSSLHQKSNNEWEAHYSVKLNQPVRINTINVEVKGENTSQKVNQYLSDLPIKKDNIFNTTIYNKLKYDLYNLISNEGYIKAKFTNSLILNIKTYKAYINILINTESKYFIGKIQYLQDTYPTKFMDRVVKKNLPSHFSSQALIELQRKMEHSDYFKKVDIDPMLEHLQGKNVPINISYTVPKKIKYTASVGYGTLTGPKISSGISVQRLSENGAHFEAGIILSQILASLHASYLFPGTNPLTDEWMIGFKTQVFNPKAGTSKSGKFNIGYHTEYNSLKFKMNINSLLDRYTINSSAAMKSHMTYPSLKVTYLNTDDVASPTHGTNFIFYLLGGSSQLLSSTNFLQSEVKGKYLFKPVDFGKMIIKGDFGYTVVKDLQKFPLSLRFFAGGMNSIRGFPEDSIGPGRYLYTGSFEYRNRIKNDLYAAFFYDLGNATDHYNNLLNKSVGLGAVYETMVGSARIYLAKAISKPSKPYSIEFSIGPEF